MITSEQEKKLILNYQNGWTWKQLQDKYSPKDPKAIATILKKYNIPLRVKKTDKNLYPIFIEKYLSGLTCKEIGKQLNIGYWTVHRYLKKNNLTRNHSVSKRMYSLNESVFETINPNSAYWIGFLASDGNLYCRKVQNHFEYVLQISLANKDKEHLVKFQKFLGSTRPLVKDGIDATKLTINSKKIFYDLHKYNLTPSKSFTLTVFEELKYNRDFWRGMIDGDGSIYQTQKGNYAHKSISLTGSKFVCEAFIDLLRTKFNYSPALVKSKSVYQVSIGKRLVLLQVLEFLYKDSETYLDRKYEKAMCFLKEG